MIMKKGTKPNPERVWKFIEIPKNPKGCWIWIGCIGRDGYGQFMIYYRHFKAHRFVYEYLLGEIPKGLTLDHLCRNRACVNPDHLEPVTLKKNLSRGSVNKFKGITHCIRGHKFTKENTYLTMNGRYCIICRKIRDKESYQRKKLLVVAN